MKRHTDAPADDPELFDADLDTDLDSDLDSDVAPTAPPAATAATAATAPTAPAESAAGSDVEEAGAALTEREQEILAFERKWWKHAGAKEQAIRDAFDLSATRYYRLLNGLLDNPAALAHDPVLVGRLRRLRSTRARTRRR
ncbi:DUF3263 domain-containing protein [Actinomycetes bacterium KLBMP 9797]